MIAGDCPLLAKFIREKRQTISLTLIIMTGKEGLLVTPSKNCSLTFLSQESRTELSFLFLKWLAVILFPLIESFGTTQRLSALCLWAMKHRMKISKPYKMETLFCNSVISSYGKSKHNATAFILFLYAIQVLLFSRY